MKNKDLIQASIGIAFGGAAMKAIGDSDMPQPYKSLGNVMVGAAVLKNTGKKLKVL